MLTRNLLRVGMCCVSMFAVACLFSLSSTAAAQSTATCTPGSMSYTSYGVNQKVGAPFTGTVKTTFEQTLANGNRIHNEAQSVIDRDSAGRTRTEMARGCERGEDGQFHPQLDVQVYDPATHTHLSWQVGGNWAKVVQVFHEDSIQPKPPTPEQQAEQQRQMKLAQVQQQLEQKNNKQERLGTRDINDQVANGTRYTRTIPAGAEGNDQLIETVQEMWSSKDLDLMLLGISDDPRRGKTTYEFETLTLSEPDPSLFAAPAGYKVVDIHPDPVTGLVTQ